MKLVDEGEERKVLGLGKGKNERRERRNFSTRKERS